MIMAKTVGEALQERDNAIAKTAEAQAKTAETVAALTKELSELKKRTPAPGTPNPAEAFGANVRRGEDTMTSRGFSFAKMLGLISGQVRPQDATVEVDFHNRLANAMPRDFAYAGVGQKYLAPFATSFLHDDYTDPKFRTEMRQALAAGTAGADPDQMAWIRNKGLGVMGSVGGKTLSWLNDTLGGALVPPPEFGELIELPRNKEALINAGARTVPLPPQGRMKFPKQTSPTLAYWVGENAPLSASDVGTGEVSLQAKKLAILCKMPNELLRFASPAAEAIVRDDMTKSLALGLDLAGLEGLGGDNRPLGVIYQQGITNFSSSQQTANGDRVVGTDIYRMVANLEELNVEGSGFIMRPKTLYKYYQLRSDAVAQGDSQGPFLFSLIREAGETTKPMLAGKPVTTSNQVSMVRSKGNASNLTYVLYGKWDELLIGMFGAIEFAATTQGDTPFVYDQTWVRAILSADIAVRYPAAFLLLDNLDTTL